MRVLALVLAACSAPTKPTPAPREPVPVDASVADATVAIDAYSILEDARARLERAIEPLIGSSVVIHDVTNGTIKRYCVEDLQHFIPGWQSSVARAKSLSCRRGPNDFVICNATGTMANNPASGLMFIMTSDLARVVGVATIWGSLQRSPAQLAAEVDKLYAEIAAPDACPPSR